LKLIATPYVLVELMPKDFKLEIVKYLFEIEK